MNTLRLNLEHEQQDRHLDDTPLRGDRPRYRRANSELLIGENSTSPRPWFLASTPYQEIVDEDSEQCRTQNVPDSDDGKTIRIRPSLPLTQEIYPGDRFIPRRRDHSFQAAYHLLKQQPDDDFVYKNKIDYCKQVESLNVTYQREAMRAMMISQECVPGLNQKRVLQTFVEHRRGLSDSAAQGRSESSETKGTWKCAPRKKPLIDQRRPEKMLGLSTDQSDDARSVDYSCMDVFVVGRRNSLTIYDSNGTVLDTLRSLSILDTPTAVKWSNDGIKIACTFSRSMQFKLYDSQKKKFSWSVRCYCSNYATSCSNRCICWSHNDRLIVIACSGTLSVFQSNTGKLLLRKHVHLGDIITLNFSSSFQYLASTAQDKCVQIYTWPNLIERYSIEFASSIKAVAWHPEISGLLCVGGARDASLSLWNINTYAMIDYVPAKCEGRVENLAWNKLSGELVVHWSYAVGNKRHSVIPVLANFERTVDAIPLDNKDERLSFLKFSTTHRQLVMYNNDVFSVWNFFGNEEPPGARCLPLYSNARQKQGVIAFNSIR